MLAVNKISRLMQLSAYFVEINNKFFVKIKFISLSTVLMTKKSNNTTIFLINMLFIS